MTKLWSPEHPSFLIKEMAMANPNLEFSAMGYSYNSNYDGLLNKYSNDEEILFDVETLDLVDQFIQEQASFGRDVVFSSSVFDKKDNGTFYLPMVDFLFKPDDRAVLEQAENNLDQLNLWDLRGFKFYKSGRSYHAYGTELFDSEQWREFLGSLLLLNQPYGNPAVDWRWIGHSIRRNSSFLRWTKIDDRYLDIPTLVENPFQALLNERQIAFKSAF